MIQLYNDVSFETSRLITKSYSTSFSRAVSLLSSEMREAVFSIYGFVRIADEVVDTFHDHDKETLLNEFERDLYDALKHNISLNPVLHSFQLTIKKYDIEDHLIQAFLKSMKTDLLKSDHLTKPETDEYIYGSAEVVGLMCLKVFVQGDKELYKKLELSARRLGAAFQKVNFLRDIKNDTEILKRSYFHEIAGKKIDENTKKEIVRDIEDDFSFAITGLKLLPHSSRLGVLIAYYYYRHLLRILKRTHSSKLMEKRIRVPDYIKILLLVKAWVFNKLNIV
ncbi:MAG: phytoene synthase [Bacteroidetes bacterium]|jgi:phytoene/squalene synthetase|nr:phytoene synthase [Bacteroidota bacterium]